MPSGLCTGAHLRRACALLGILWMATPLAAHAQGATPDKDKEPAPAVTATPATPAQASPAAASGGQEWCELPLCKEAEGLRRSGDLQGALKLYRYIQAEVAVDEAVLQKPLLWYPIAALYGALQKPQEGLDALQKYQQYIATRPDAELPAGQRREDATRLGQDLRASMARVRIHGDAPGLRVTLDGKDMGVTPLAEAMPVQPGRHRVELGRTVATAQDIEVRPGQEVLILPVQPLSAPGAGPTEGLREARPRWRIALGAIGLVGGAAMIAGGAAALANDGQCVDAAPAGMCPLVKNMDGLVVRHLVDAKATGGGLIATGILMSAAGAVLVALPGKRLPVRAAVSFHQGASLNLAATF